MNRISSAITTNDKVHRCVVTLSNKPKINFYFSLCGKNVTVHFSKLHFFSTVSVSSCMWWWWMVVVEHHDLTSPIHSYNELKVEKNATSNFEIISSPWRSHLALLHWPEKENSYLSVSPSLDYYFQAAWTALARGHLAGSSSLERIIGAMIQALFLWPVQ